MSKGASAANLNEQPMSAVKTGRSGHPVQNDGGRARTGPASSSAAPGMDAMMGVTFGASICLTPCGILSCASIDGAYFWRNRRTPEMPSGYTRGLGQQFPCRNARGLLPVFHDGCARSLDILALFEHQHGVLVLEERLYFEVYDRVHHVHDVDRQWGSSVDIGQPQQFQGAHQRVVEPALDDQSDMQAASPEDLIESMLLDERLGRRPALGNLLVLMHEGCRGQGHALDVAPGRVEGILDGEWRPPVFGSDEAAVGVTGAHTHRQHGGRAAGFGQLGTPAQEPRM
ncbi:hypothetical protein FQR65_LT20674 [Abscondita terminalis]|nr:hypothetical protein FQR65_LT20674 [Abscondita terminalis]